MALTGRIIEEQKNHFLIDTPAGTIRAAAKGSLRRKEKRVCVGDIVECETTNADTGEGIILSVRERSSYLSRPPLANLTQVVIVCTLREPPLNLEAVDRFLVCVSACGLMPALAFNKYDLLTGHERASLQDIAAAYTRGGYTTVITSASTGSGVGELAEICAGKVSAFAGLSGVGKSALLTRIFPDRKFRIGGLSGPAGRGTHTTTCVTLLPLDNGGYIADTPGLSFIDLPLIPEEDVAGYFPEIGAQTGRCRFNDCAHGNEPGCKVRALIDAGEIAAWRVEHYLKIFGEIRERRRGYRDGKS